MTVVVALVTLVLAACGSGDGGGGTTTLSVTGTNELGYEPEQLAGDAGSVTIELTAEDAVEHTFVIEDLGDRQVVAADAGSTATGTVALEAGTYTFYCDVPGHRDAGMEGTLEIR
ncbi:MAG: cupredoxin domain-containing protein [Actinobacteria bacterium]|nr:cupredoxin domain-containing protein [Actinomycetota bacterium]